jgi:hypothetical protein
MWATCHLKDSGSLSLALLAIQAPGGTLNALFMWIGQEDDWTTWISILAASVQQFILLGICVFFKLRKRRVMQQKGKGDDSSLVGLNDSIKERLIDAEREMPVPDDNPRSVALQRLV